MRRSPALLFILALVFSLCSILLVCTAHAKSHDSAYLQRLSRQVQEQKLADERMWHLLLHYKPRLFGGVKSEADGEGFFFHPRGKVDPHGELDATLRAFFSEEDGRQQDENWQHPQCRFPARYHWLKTQLDFDTRRLPERSCPRFDAWRHALDPGSVSLIFAAYYMNNPASMFGHTLLRLNHKGRQGAPKLLDYGINYAATTTTTNGILFAFFGIFGGFKGHFANFPYYLKVEEYSNLNSRDLWEYDLQFTQGQIDRMLRHLWELGSTYFWYYFLQENCSYHILSLLEVADPRLHLSNQFRFQVIPAETVRLITEQDGLVGNVVYRPSILSQFAHKQQAMTPTEVGLLRESIKTKSLSHLGTVGLEEQREALVLDAALDLVQYRKMKNQNVLPPDARAFRRALLLRRSQLGLVSPPVFQEPLSSRPERGHGTSRFRLAVGLTDDDMTFVELSFPSFHDLLDPQEGFPMYAHIQFLTLTVRYYREDERLDIEQLDLVRITSLSPLEPFIKKPSWRIDVGYQTLRDIDCGLCHWWKAEVGTGVAVRLHRQGDSLTYAFVNLEAGLAEAFDTGFRLAPGLIVGVTVRPLRLWKVHVAGSVYYPVVGGHTLYYRNLVHQHIAFTRNLGLRLEVNHFRTVLEGLVALQWYF